MLQNHKLRDSDPTLETLQANNLIGKCSRIFKSSELAESVYDGTVPLKEKDMAEYEKNAYVKRVKF